MMINEVINKKRMSKALLIGVILILSLSASLFADDKDANKSFMNWLLEEADDEGAKKSESQKSDETYDYFLDKNDNGIDDRIENENKSEQNKTSEQSIFRSMMAPSRDEPAGSSASRRKTSRSKSFERSATKILRTIDDATDDEIHEKESRPSPATSKKSKDSGNSSSRSSSSGNKSKRVK